MNESPDALPPNASAAFTRLFPKEKRSWRQGIPKPRLADLGHGTAGLEFRDGKVALHWAEDCPFEEISPGYLTIFVRQLARLCPGVEVAYRPGYGHPVVATLWLEPAPDESEEVWAEAIRATLPRLEAALSKQPEAAHDLSEDGPLGWSRQLPEVEVFPDQLHIIGSLADDFVKAQAELDEDALRYHQYRFVRRTKSFDIFQPDLPWIDCLRHDDFRGGFWDLVRVEQFTASQLVVLINVLHQGNVYNTALFDRARSSGLLTRICLRARELLKATPGWPY